MTLGDVCEPRVADRKWLAVCLQSKWTLGEPSTHVSAEGERE